MSDNTIFDDVFRTMMEKMTLLVVPLINDVFHTSYPADVEIVQLRNEYQRVDGEARYCKVFRGHGGCVMSISGWMVRLLRIRGC